MKNQSVLPSNRYNRLFRLGRLASGVAGSALSEGVKKLARGELPVAAEMILTPANATRISEQLSQMRGAVMKVGQLLSMEAGDLLPKELTDILANLRDSAHSMPHSQLHEILSQAWGEHWRDNFLSFDEQPFAAASIGQVHEALDTQGRKLAIKIQYPEVARSIDSDVDNVASLLKWFRLLPTGLDIQPLLETAKRQLHDETDYRLEAQYLRSYRACFGDDDFFVLPEVLNELSTENVLVMTFVEGDSIEALRGSDQQLRDQIASRLIELLLREILHWGMVQTDPNYANFRFDPATGKIGLLDFGALRIHRPELTRCLHQLLVAAMQQDLAAIVEAACGVGYVDQNDPFNYRLAIADLIRTAAEPAVHVGEYDFRHSLLSQRLGDKLVNLRKRKDFQRIPPGEVIFLHRKLAGIYLLCSKLNVRVDVRTIMHGILNARSRPLARAS